MLTTRERKILELLYRNEKALTTAEIANSLHISTRTIKSDIPKISLGAYRRGAYQKGEQKGGEESTGRSHSKRKIFPLAVYRRGTGNAGA